MASPKDVLKQIADNEVKFVDFRFTDTIGREHHISVPVSQIDEDKLESGQAFDGSSIPGWKGIEASDMLLIPDMSTANLDPFREEPTLILSCDVVEPSDLKGYDRDPRSLAKRAEAYLKSSGLGDTAYFGPEPEFFVFDGVTWNSDMSGTFVKIKSEEAPWSSGLEFEGGNTGHRPTVKGGYFPVPPVDSFQDMRSEMCLLMEQMGVPVEVHHHEVAGAGQLEIGTLGALQEALNHGVVLRMGHGTGGVGQLAAARHLAGRRTQERQAERGDIQNADVALAIDLAFRHGQLRIQHIIRDKSLLFPLSSGRLGKTFLPGQVGYQAFKDKLGSVACGCIAAEVIGREQQRGEKEQQPQNRAKRSAFNHDLFSFSRACPKSEAAAPPQRAPEPATREAPSAGASDAQVYWSE